ncbi:hypothetical protein A235_24789, partial [Pseudomonas syringae pv. actinidiae ICMP 19079]
NARRRLDRTALKVIGTQLLRIKTPTDQHRPRHGMRQWPVLDEFGATVREVGSLSHARHFAGGLDWREECWVSSSSTIVRRSASHAVL